MSDEVGEIQIVEQDPFETETESEFEGPLSDDDIVFPSTLPKIPPQDFENSAISFSVPRGSSTLKKARRSIAKRAALDFPCAWILRKLKQRHLAKRIQTSKIYLDI